MKQLILASGLKSDAAQLSIQVRSPNPERASRVSNPAVMLFHDAGDVFLFESSAGLAKRTLCGRASGAVELYGGNDIFDPNDFTGNLHHQIREQRLQFRCVAAPG